MIYDGNVTNVSLDVIMIGNTRSWSTLVQARYHCGRVVSQPIRCRCSETYCDSVSQQRTEFTEAITHQHQAIKVLLLLYILKNGNMPRPVIRFVILLNTPIYCCKQCVQFILHTVK